MASELREFDELLARKEEQRRLIASTKRSFRLASDEEALRMIESPRPPVTQGDMATVAMLTGRGGLVLRALERGVLTPDTQCEMGALVHYAATHGPVQLLRSLVMGRGVDPTEVDTEGWRPRAQT